VSASVNMNEKECMYCLSILENEERRRQSTDYYLCLHQLSFIIAADGRLRLNGWIPLDTLKEMHLLCLYLHKNMWRLLDDHIIGSIWLLGVSCCEAAPFQMFPSPG
jgi:hypothetical protein